MKNKYFWRHSWGNRNITPARQKQIDQEEADRVCRESSVKYGIAFIVAIIVYLIVKYLIINL